MKTPTDMLRWTALLVVAALLVVPPSVAQEPPSGTQDEDHSVGRRRQRGPRRHRGTPGRGPDLALRLFRVVPADREPLGPHEEDELLAFAREHMPRFYRAMEGLRRRDPERFRDKLAEYAPRLRHLRRIFEHSPRIGIIIQEHTENTVKIRGGLRTLRSTAPDSALHRRALQDLRSLVAENVRLEADALEVLAAEREEHRAQQVESRVAHLLDEKVDLAPEPEHVRKLVSALHAAPAEAQREELRSKIGELAARQVDNGIKALHERIARMRESALEQVDHRMARMLESLEKNGRPRRGRGRGHPR